MKSWRFLKIIFFKTLFWSIWIWFSDVWFFWSQSWHAYSKCEPKSVWYVIFKVPRLDLCLSLLKIPIALINFILILDDSLAYWSIHLEVPLGTSRLPLLQNYSLSWSSPWCVINEFFFTWRKNNVLFSRYQDFCVFVKSTDFKISDVIISIAG